MLKKIKMKYEGMPLEVRASSVYTICSVIQKCISFITMPLFTRLLTQEQFGQATVYSSWMAVVAIFVTLNLAYGSYSTAMVKYKEQRDQYTSSVCTICIMCAGIVAAIYFPFVDFWGRFIDLPVPFVALMIGECVMGSATDFWLSKMRFEYEYRSVAIYTLLVAVVSPLLVLLIVLNATERGYARILGYSLINVCIGLVMMIRHYQKGRCFYNREFWRFALGFNIPLIPYYISQMIFNTSDRLMIDHFCGKEQAAIYGVAYTLAVVLNFVICAINNSFAPWFLTKLEAGEGGKNRRVSTYLTLFVSAGLMSIIAVAPELILIVGGRQYYYGVWAVPPVVASMLLLFYTQLFDRVLFFYEKKYFLIIGGVIPSIANFVLNCIFIPRYGLVAASYTTLVSYVLFVLINYITMRVTMKKKGNKADLFNPPALLAIFVVFCVVTVIFMMLYEHFVIRYVLILVVTIVVVVKRKQLISTFKGLK